MAGSFRDCCQILLPYFIKLFGFHYSLKKTFKGNRFYQVIQCIYLKPVKCILWKCGCKNHRRRIMQGSKELQAGYPGHLYIQEKQLYLTPRNGIRSLHGVVKLTNKVQYLGIGNILLQTFSGQWFIIYDYTIDDHDKCRLSCTR